MARESKSKRIPRQLVLGLVALVLLFAGFAAAAMRVISSRSMPSFRSIRTRA